MDLVTLSSWRHVHHFWILQSYLWLTESKKVLSFCLFFALGLLFSGGHVSFILVPLKRDPGLWDCSPFPYRHTNVDQLDSGSIAQARTNKQENRVVPADRVFNKPVVNSPTDMPAASGRETGSQSLPALYRRPLSNTRPLHHQNSVGTCCVQFVAE